MDALVTIRTVLGWCLVIHFVVFGVQAGFVMLAPDWVRGLQGRMFRLEDDDLSRAYFQYFALYKLGVMIFVLAPWVALWIAG